MTANQTSFTHAHEEDEISLLDILLTLAESWRLLVLGPLVVGVLAGSLSFLWPKTYESVVIARLSEQDLGLLGTPAVLNPVITKFEMQVNTGGIRGETSSVLVKKIASKIDKKTGFATISFAAGSPEQAKELAEAVMQSLLKELLPKGNDKLKIEQIILANERKIEMIQDVLDQMLKQIKKNNLDDLKNEQNLKYFQSLTAEVTKVELENLELRNKLMPKGAEVYVQSPSLPKGKVSPKGGMVVIISVLVSGFALLLWVFVRKSWGQAAKEADNAEKIKRIKAALSLKALW